MRVKTVAEQPSPLHTNEGYASAILDIAFFTSYMIYLCDKIGVAHPRKYRPMTKPYCFGRKLELRPDNETD